MKITLLLLCAYVGGLLFLPACTTKENMQLAADTDTVVVAVPDVTYQQPLIIRKGGLYTGNYKSTSPDTPAIWVQTSEPVEITGCIIAATGDMIRCYGSSRLSIHHNSLYGITPVGAGQWGRALNDYQPQYLKFENNYVEHTGGVLVDRTGAGADSVVIRYNIIRNTDKRRADLSAGENRSGIQFNTVLKIAGEISWNQFENQPGKSHVGDNINMYNSGGKSGAPYLIHDNYIKGAYPFPLTATSYTGSGITVDGDPAANTMDKMSQFISAYGNQVISTCNACMNLAAGHDINFFSNTMISSGRYPDGTKSDRFWGGCCMWNASNVPAANFINNAIKANRIGYVRSDKRVPFTGRQDWVVVPGNPLSVQPGENIPLSNPVTLETEKAEWPKWQAKIALNKIVIGNAAK